MKYGILFLFILVVVLCVLYLRERKRVRLLSSTDSLTALANRTAFLGFLSRELARTDRHGNPLSVLMIDIDDFKCINDTWGHGEGDRVLRKLADELKANLRSIDCIGRWGADEFAVVVSETGYDAALVVGDKLCRVTAASDVCRFKQVTVSIGVCACQVHDSVDAVLARAENALSRAKAEGKNRSCGSPVA